MTQRYEMCWHSGRTAPIEAAGDAVLQHNFRPPKKLSPTFRFYGWLTQLHYLFSRPAQPMYRKVSRCSREHVDMLLSMPSVAVSGLLPTGLCTILTIWIVHKV